MDDEGEERMSCQVARNDGLADFCKLSDSWRANGAAMIGGCCRTSVDTIRLLRERLMR